MATKRDKWAKELAPMLHSYGAVTRTAPTVNPKFAKDTIVRSSADTYAILNGGFVVEAKTGHNGTFPMGTPEKIGVGWRSDQIQWAMEYRKSTHCEYWLFVVYETKESPWRVPRDAFLVPFQAAYDVMKLLPQKSLPYKVRKGLDREIQLNSWDAVNLWGKYRLHWKSGWQVPESHLFHSLYIAPTPQVPMTIEGIAHGNSYAISADPA